MVGTSMAESASASEKDASPSDVRGSPSTNPTASQPRSCIVCRTRKVRCDRRSPCSNCRRANIACAYPTSNRPPRWARRFETLSGTTGATPSLSSTSPAVEDDEEGFDRVMDRLQTLENLVHELKGQLNQKHAADSSGENTLGSVQTQFGRLVLHDSSRSRYVSSGFWARVDDELDGLQNDLAGADSGDLEEQERLLSFPTSHVYERGLWERHALLFRHYQSSATLELRCYHPSSSQRSVLLDIFKKNIHCMIQLVHMPTVFGMLREMRGDEMPPANEALMFSIYYAAVASLDESEALKNFRVNKSDLTLKYRSGLEMALAKADCLNNPDINVIQALAIFLMLSRGSENPRYIWMLTGLVIRMAQCIGLHRDGSHFQRLAPYEVEIRRRVWWLILSLDLATSEDQGVDLIIANDSFDAKIPLNFNEGDISVETKRMPEEREGVTDMSITRLFCYSCKVVRQMMAASRKNSATNLQEQSHMLDDFYRTYEKNFLQYKDPEDTAYRFTVNVARITMAKMRLIVFLPVLFSSPSEQFTNEIRNKLLVSAIEVAEYNHALHAEQAYSQWRWICHTHTHWHAIVFLLIEILRRPWSSTVERAWVALHSPWLIPAGSVTGKSPRTWIPLQRLIAKARKHREAELSRLRADVRIAAQLELEDQKIPLPLSVTLVPPSFGIDSNCARWRQLVSLVAEAADGDLSGPMHQGQAPFSTDSAQSTARVTDADTPSLHTESTRPTADLSLGFGSIPWLWADADPSVDVSANVDVGAIDVNMDLDPDVNWHDWIVSATGVAVDEGFDGDGRV